MSARPVFKTRSDCLQRGTNSVWLLKKRTVFQIKFNNKKKKTHTHNNTTTNWKSTQRICFFFFVFEKLYFFFCIKFVAYLIFRIYYYAALSCLPQMVSRWGNFVMLFFFLVIFNTISLPMVCSCTRDSQTVYTVSLKHLFNI